MVLPTSPFGRTADGTGAVLYGLENATLRVCITDYGGRLVSVEAPDRAGRRAPVVLGFDAVAGYGASGSFGALLGRVANRIAGGRFTLDGATYELDRNEKDATLHGGPKGFGKVFWRLTAQSETALTLAYRSPDGDQGFPGTLDARASWSLEADSLTLLLEAETSKPTPVNLSAHPYFNLAGPDAADMLDHEITIAASAYLPTDERQIPLGERRAVAGTPFDFRQPTRVGAHIRSPDPQLLRAKGYDHCFVLDRAGDMSRPALRARHAASGRVLEIATTQPGLQFYTGNNLDGSLAGRGGAYRQSAGFAVEPQGFPDAVNQPTFPSVILRPGAQYRQTIRYRFSIE